MAFSETRQLDILLKVKDQASKELNGLSESLGKMEPAFTKMAAVGTASFAAIGFGVKGAVDAAVDLGESVNAVNVVFAEGSENILEFGKTAARSVGLANSEFNQMATITGALLKDTGKPLNEVADLTIELTKRAADMASVFNTDVNDAMSAINQAIRGETEAIRRYAGDVSDATLQTYLNSKGIKENVTDLTQQEKRLYRVQLIMQQTAVTANDFQNTSESLANQQRILTAEFKDVAAELGANFIPIIQDILKTLTPILQNVAQWIKQNPELTKNIVIASAAVTALIAAIGGIGLILPSVISGIGVMGTALAATSTGIVSMTSLLMSPVGLIAALSILATVAIVKAIEAWGNLKQTQEEAKQSLIGVNEAIRQAEEHLNSLSTDEYNEQLENAINQTKELRDEAERLSNLGFFGALKEGFVGTIDKAVGKYIGVDDAVITPKGDVIKTNPRDYLIATQNPASLAGGGGNVNITITGGYYLDKNAGEKMAETISETLRRKLRI